MASEQQLRIIRLRRVKERVDLSTSTIYAMVQRGEFPHQVQIGPRRVGWIESEIDSWIQSRVRASRQVAE